MAKPILATNIDGFLINHSAFIEPHKEWFEKVIKLTGNENLRKWIGSKDYFKGVDIAMEHVMPNATPEQRTLQARHWYQEAVVKYIEENPEIVNHQLGNWLTSLKEKYTIALITSNTSEYIHQILKAADLNDIYDIIFSSSALDKPDKAKLFKEFSKKYGKPKYYIASRNKEAFEQCLLFGENCIYFAQEEINPEIQEIAHKTINNKKELNELIQN